MGIKMGKAIQPQNQQGAGQSVGGLTWPKPNNITRHLPKPDAHGKIKLASKFEKPPKPELPWTWVVDETLSGLIAGLFVKVAPGGKVEVRIKVQLPDFKRRAFTLDEPSGLYVHDVTGEAIPKENLTVAPAEWETVEGDLVFFTAKRGHAKLLEVPVGAWTDTYASHLLDIGGGRTQWVFDIEADVNKSKCDWLNGESLRTIMERECARLGITPPQLDPA
jgi:hypothetical protein